MTPRAPGALGRVLVADDDPDVLRSIVAALTRAGFEVTGVDDGVPAIDLSDPLRFEIVLVDFHMKTSGLTVIRHYKQRYGSRVYCAVLSGEDDDETRAVCTEAGADEVLCKPLPASALRKRLTEVVLALRAGEQQRSA